MKHRIFHIATTFGLVAILTGCPQDAPDNNQFGGGTSSGATSSGGTSSGGTSSGADIVADGGRENPADSRQTQQDAAIAQDTTAPEKDAEAADTTPPVTDAGSDAGPVDIAPVDAGPKHEVGSVFGKQISAGQYHTCALHGSGYVSCWGDNGLAQSGFSPSKQKVLTTPNPVFGLEKVEQVSAGVTHNCAVVAGQKVRCWGHNFWGELGIGFKSNDIASAKPVAGPLLATYVQAGYDITVARTGSGLLYGWGKNTVGHFLDGTASSANQPKKIGMASAIPTMADVCTGGTQICAISMDNKVYCWGKGADGELGNGGSGVQNIAKKAVLVKNAPNKPKRIFCGRRHTCVVTEPGQLYCWGLNTSSQIGNKTTDSPQKEAVWSGQVAGVSKAALGMSHTCVLTSGQVRCWGRNDYGQVGAGTGSATVVKTVIIVKLPQKAVDVTAGREHTCAALQDGSVMCWGRNQKGQLGNGDTDTSYSPVLVKGSK